MTSVGTWIDDAFQMRRPVACMKLSSSTPLGARRLAGVRVPLVGSVFNASSANASRTPASRYWLLPSTGISLSQRTSFAALGLRR